MYYCERCGSSYNSVRAKYLTDCPRCLLRSDIASPLIEIDESVPRRPAAAKSTLKREADRLVSPSA